MQYTQNCLNKPQPTLRSICANGIWPSSPLTSRRITVRSQPVQARLALLVFSQTRIVSSVPGKGAFYCCAAKSVDVKDGL
ncbi:hypothetical protein PICMEDRAFT_17551, partial [Pichia membranifaciens NRRL Y-2026]